MSVSTQAFAGGFAVREQSAEFQGMSFAGNAAGGGGLSGMYWNPAIAAYAPAGLYSESSYSGIMSHVTITGDSYLAGTPVNLGLPRESGDIAKDAFVGASYMSWRLNSRLVAAISINSPFGLVTEPANRFWAGQTFARTSDIKTYNFSPTLAYMLTPQIAIGAGLQIQHIEATLKSATGPSPLDPNVITHGDDTSFGFTLGINYAPTRWTNIGLGYRSSIDQTLEGTVRIPDSLFPPAARGTAVKAGTTLPDLVTLSLRQGLTERFTLLATAEWTHWSRLEKLNVVCVKDGTPGNPAFCPLGNGQVVNSLDLGWHDSWFFSVGGG
ncbi:MAG: OmpP1/FadL family transporter [Hyphomicrobiaceae bacterium]